MTGGVTYRIAVGGAGGYFGFRAGDLVVNWRTAAAPANDAFAARRTDHRGHGPAHRNER